VGVGEILLPTSGFAGLAGRAVLWLAYPAALLTIGFLHPDERSRLAAMLRPSAIAARARGLRAAPAPAGAEGGIGQGARLGPEVYEVAARDEDRGGT
jgi:hypothetical protein